MLFLVFVFGLIIGSFLNAVIFRLRSGESIITARSHCMKCGHTLAWYELMPLASFVIQQGKCRACKRNISWQYPAVEIATAVLFLLIFNFKFLIFKQFLIFEFLNLAFYIGITSFLIIIFVYDLKHYIIPDKVIYPAIILTFLYQSFEFLSLNNWDLFKNLELEIKNFEPLIVPLFVAVIAASFFALIFFVSRGKWLGFGDVKLAFFMGLFLGWPNILVALFVAFVLGGIIGVGLVAARKKTMKSEVPFGPFLVIGTFAAVFLGNRIVEWYLNLLLI